MARGAGPRVAGREYPAERKGLALLHCSDPPAWEGWLEVNHDRSPGVFLMLAKRGVNGLYYTDALDVALCFGWIDSQKAGLDELYFLQRFTPRGPRSRWSQINRDRALALTRSKRMRPAGRAQVQLARKDGRWEEAYAGQRTAEVPDDLRAALDADPSASAFFAQLDGANRYAILYRVGEAKRADTRAQRIERFVAMCANGEKLHP